MTKKQYACIMQAKEVMKEIRSLAIHAQDACRSLGDDYHAMSRIESICDKFLDDFGDVDPNWTWRMVNDHEREGKAD